MEYEVRWRTETESELRVFSHKHQQAIIRKIKNIASNIPTSLRLRTVQHIRGAILSGNRQACEIDIGSGPRAAVVIDDDAKTVTVYMVGTHDYALKHYLSALDERVEP